MSALGEFIKDRLAELDMNQNQLAKKIGVGSGQVTQWISGTRPTKHIEALADALECTEGELIELIGTERKPGPKPGRKPGGGRKRSADWQFEIRDSYDLTLPEEKPSNGNGSKATITSPITPKGKPNGSLRAKIAILENVAAAGECCKWLGW